MLAILDADGEAALAGNGVVGTERSNNVRGRLSSISRTNGPSAITQGAVLWRYGEPTQQTNKFNPMLPTNLPPPVTDKPLPETNSPSPVTNKTMAATNGGGAVEPPPPGATNGTNHLIAVVPDPVVWQYGQPTTRTNKFKPLLPTNAPPVVVEKYAPEAAPAGHGTNQTAAATNQAAVVPNVLPVSSGTNGDVVVWKYGKPTVHTNKFNPSLPTNLPPAVVDKNAPESSHAGNPALPANQPPPATNI